MAWRTPSAQQDLVDTARRLCLDRVYVDVTGAATADNAARQKLRNDITALAGVAAARGLEIGAVAGDRWWPSAQGELDAAEVLAFVAEVNQFGSVISEFHVDAEPWGLDEWPTQKATLTSAYLDLVTALERRRSELGLRVPVAYLVPYWFDGSNGEAPQVRYSGRLAFPFDHLASILGHRASVVVMAYRNRALGPGGIIDLVTAETRQRSTPVEIAVETAPIDPPTATFAGGDLTQLAEQLRAVADKTGLSAITINDVEHLRQLPAGNSAERP